MKIRFPNRRVMKFAVLLGLLAGATHSASASAASSLITIAPVKRDADGNLLDFLPR